MRNAPVLPKLAISLTTVALALCAVSSASADPVTRVIAPGGAGIECSVAQPCSYAYATSDFGSNAGDTVFALPGTYDVSGAPMDVTHRLTILADPNFPRPVFTTSDPKQTTVTVETTANGTVLKHLDIRAIGAFEGLRANGRVDASDMAISGTFRCAGIYSAGSVLRDSTLTGQPSGSPPVCLDTWNDVTLSGLTVSAPTGTGVILEFGGATLEDSTVTALRALQLSEGPTDSTIRRVSLSGSEYGLRAIQSGRATVTDSVISASAGTAAVEADYNDTALHLRNDTILATGTGAAGILALAQSGTLSPGQIDARNVIVKAAGPDLRSEVAANPASCIPAPCASGALTVDHSAFADSNGPLMNGGANIAGDPGFVDAAGQDFHLAPGSPAIDAGMPDGLTQGTDRDGHVRFQGGGLDLGAYEATPVPAQPQPVAPQDPAANPQTALPAAVTRDLQAPVLTGVRVVKRAFRYRLSETATVKIEVARRAGGKRFRHAFTLKRAGHTGANRTKPRTLKPGTYRATVTARDAAGNTSRKVVLEFRIGR